MDRFTCTATAMCCALYGGMQIRSGVRTSSAPRHFLPRYFRNLTGGAILHYLFGGAFRGKSRHGSLNSPTSEFCVETQVCMLLVSSCDGGCRFGRLTSRQQHTDRCLAHGRGFLQPAGSSCKGARLGYLAHTSRTSPVQNGRSRQRFIGGSELRKSAVGQNWTAHPRTRSCSRK